MEKRLSKLSGQKEKVQSSCVWGLVDIFDLGNGRSNQKLLTNGRKTVQRNVSDIEHLRKVQTIGSCRGKSQVFEVGAGLEMHDSGAFDQSIKNLLNQELDTLKKPKTQKEASKKMLKNSDFELVLNQLQDEHKKPRTLSKKLANQLHIQHWNDKFLLGPEQSSDSTPEILLDKQNLEAMFGDICRYDELDQANAQLLQITAKAFVDQIYINGKNIYKDGVSSKSKYFSDASEILNLNMDLFLKLLQDSNSLLPKNIQPLQFPLMDKERMKLYLESGPSESGSSARTDNQDPEDTMKIQKRNSNNPLWKKFKDRYGCSSKGNTTAQASKKIVVLKPISNSKQNSEGVSCHCSSMQAHQSLKNKGQKKVKSNYFSFKDIKKKFQQAVGENQHEQQLISMDEHLRRLARKKHLLKDIDMGNSWGGKGKYALPSGAERREKRSKTPPSGETVGKNLNSSTSSSSKQRQFDIYMEAKRHLSERLRNVDMGDISERKEAPRTLKMVLSSPENDDFLTTYSPKRDKMTTPNTLQNEKGKEMDFTSPLKDTEELPSCDCRRCDQLEISEFTPKISKKLHADPEPSGSVDILKANEVLLQGSSNIFEAPYELNSSSDTSSSQGSETAKEYDENRYMDSSDMTVPSENHPLRPLSGSSRSLNTHELEVLDTAKYKEEHASPVSVLEPFSPDDVNSPTFITDKQDKSSLQPRRLDFDDYSQVISPEDPKSNRNFFMDVEESLHLYVKAVMEASELSFFDDIYLKGPSTQDVLYTYIADGMGLCPIESYIELQLLFDCIHEVLLGLYESHFGCPPWLSFLRQKITPLPLENNVVDEVVKEVNMYLLPKTEQPTLEQLMRKDIAKYGSWIDLCPDTEQILIQIAEDVLQDFIEDTILEVQI